MIDSAKRNLGGTILTTSANGDKWEKRSGSFNASATEPKAKLNIWFEGDGVIDLDMISLFPSDTWKNRPGGMRADMIQLLADLKPGFIRFPGGCIVEGSRSFAQISMEKNHWPYRRPAIDHQSLEF